MAGRGAANVRGSNKRGRSNSSASLNNEETDTSRIETMFRQIIDGQEESRVELRESISSIKTTLQNQQKEIDEIKIRLDNGIPPDQSINRLSSNQEFLECEINKINLVISGINEIANETLENLSSTITALCKSITGVDIKLDTVYRIGRQNSSKPRLVKVRFLTMADRDRVWANKSNAKHPVYFSKDLPFATRRDFAVMRKKAKDLNESEIEFVINWNRKTITTSSNLFRAVNGELREEVVEESQRNFLGLATSSQTQKQ